ncbi:MAG: DNA alkylation repair protein [Candidatus Portiera sp.]|nr:DNA alkylation repair protein [Portiera sp.]
MQQTLIELQKQLKALGTAQNCKVYARHGADPDKVYGVSFANLDKLAKSIIKNNRVVNGIDTDHKLARELWNTGNYDCRNLALKIGDGKVMDEKEITAWIKQLKSYTHISMLGKLIAQHPQANKLPSKLCNEKDEIKRGLGFSIISSILAQDPQRIPSKQLKSHLQQIEKDIHSSANWARYSMNWTLISIGTYGEYLKDDAIAVAHKIGKVEVDHGETSCKTPDAASYIEKSYRHFQTQLQKQLKAKANS